MACRSSPIDRSRAAAGRSTRWSSRAGSAPATRARPADDRLAAAGCAPLAARHLGLHGRVPAGPGGAARRAARDDALGVVRRARPQLPVGHGRARPDLRARRQRLHVGRRDRRASTSRSRSSRRTSGARAALDVARALVLFVRRPGGQAQFSAGLAGQAAPSPGLSRAAGLDRATTSTATCRSPALAERAFMSPRNFARVFSREVGVTPAAYVEALRLERARVLLETTDAAARGDRAALRLRHGRDAAARLRPAPAASARATTAAGFAGRDPRPAPPMQRRQRHPDQERHAMNIAIPIFDRLTALDAIGPYEVLSRLPGATRPVHRGRARPEAHRDRDARADRRPRARRAARPRT